jgi:ankyrin repeat protein
VNRCNTLTGGTPLHITCSSPKALEGRLKCAKLLLDHGADPLLPDSRGMTPMAYAAEEPEMAALLEPFAARANSLAAGAEEGEEGGGAAAAATAAITNGESGDE